LPEAHKGTPQEIVNTYLRGTPLWQLFSGSVPFNPPDETRFSGHWIWASQGKGKTTLLTAMALQDFDKDAAVIIIDSKGELIEAVGTLKQYEDRYVVIDPRYAGQLHADSRAAVRPHGLLGPKYVDLQGGTTGQLHDGATIPLSRTTVSTDFDQVLNSLQPDIRANLKTIFVELGRAADGRGATMNAAFATCEPGPG